jgi:hypothetical protein
MTTDIDLPKAPSSPLQDDPGNPLGQTGAEEPVAIPVGEELGKAAKSLLWASRKGLYPVGVMGAVYAAGTVLHEQVSADPLWVLAGGGATVVAGACLQRLGGLPDALRSFLTRPWRRHWATGCLAAATAWTAAAAAGGASMDTLMPTTLVAGGALLAAPWWWTHRLRTREDHRPAAPAVQAALTAAAPLPAIEAAPARHPHQIAWGEHVGAPRGALQFSDLIDPEPITDHIGEPNGTTWVLDGGPERHTYNEMRHAMEDIKATLDRPHVDSLIYLDQDPQQYKTRGRLIVLERNPLIQEIVWPGPSLDPATGLVPISVYPDGSGWAHYVLYVPDWGVSHDLFAGAPGTGKSSLIHLVAGESLNAGSAVLLYDPHGGGSFEHLVPRTTRSFLDDGEIYAGMRGLEAAHAERVEILHEVGEKHMGPEHGHPMIHAIIDEASHKAVLGNPLISEILTPIGREGRKLWIKLTVALQDPGVQEGFHDNGELLDLLLAGNVVLFRVASNRITRNIKIGEAEVAPHLLPKFFDREQKLPTTGLGYVLTGTPCELPSRTARVMAGTFNATVPMGSPFDDRTGEAFERGYVRGIAELERLAEQAERSSIGRPGNDGRATLHAVPNSTADPGAKDRLVELFQQRGQVTIADIRQADICSPSRAYDLLNELMDKDRLIERVEGARGCYRWRAAS